MLTAHCIYPRPFIFQYAVGTFEVYHFVQLLWQVGLNRDLYVKLAQSTVPKLIHPWYSAELLIYVIPTLDMEHGGKCKYGYYMVAIFKKPVFQNDILDLCFKTSSINLDTNTIHTCWYMGKVCCVMIMGHCHHLSLISSHFSYDRIYTINVIE